MFPLTHLLFASSWFTAAAFPWFMSWWLEWSEICDMRPSTVTFVYWLITGGDWLLFLSLFEGVLLKRLLQNSLADELFLTLLALPSLLFLSLDGVDALSTFFMVIVIIKFGFSSLLSSLLCESLAFMSINSLIKMTYYSYRRVLFVLSRNKLKGKNKY